MISSYEDIDSAESNKSAENSDNQVNMSTYYKTVTRVNKGKSVSKDRYVFINELIENFNYDRKKIEPIFKYTNFVEPFIGKLMPISVINSDPSIVDYEDGELNIIEDIPSGSLEINPNFLRIQRGIVFVVGNIIHATIIIFDLDTNIFYNTGFGFYGDDPDDGIKIDGALYTVDYVLPEKDQSAGIIWVQELTPKIKHNIQEELFKIDKIYYKFKIIDKKNCILTNNHILKGFLLINFYKSEYIYEDFERHGRRPDDVANCVRWAFGVIDQSDVLYDPRIRLCNNLKKPEFCRVLRNRLWTKLKENMMIYLESDSDETKDYVHSEILDSLKDINNRFLRRRRKTKKKSVSPRKKSVTPRKDPGKVTPRRELYRRNTPRVRRARSLSDGTRRVRKPLRRYSLSK
jgi:hypothetical protein